MNDRDIRIAIVNGLAQATAILFRDAEISEDFIAGKADMRFEDMQLDSLSIMELCISLEIDTGVSILPEEMLQIESVGQLAHVIGDRLK
jgi:acyl carrier protein